MINTTNHAFHKPEDVDFILDTINQMAENFEKLDGMIDESAMFLNSFLVEGKSYNIGKRIWNSQPSIGDNVGWVNIRTGKHAPEWTSQKAYKVGDKVISVGNNGHVYECLEDGFSAILEPVFTTVANSIALDFNGKDVWNASYVYNVGDIVVATNGNQSHYFICEISGVSGTTEPTWTNTEGVTVNDNSILWRTHKTAKWKEVGASCEFREFGMIN
jgi:hypothetical protein